MESIAATRALYRTPGGTAYVGDSLEGMQAHLADESVALFFTSPPFALSRSKEYGNKPESEYIAWFREFALVMWDKLRPDGSLVVDLGGAWRKGSPTRSLYQFKLLIELCEGLEDKNFFLAQEFYWHNPSKMPLPAQWVNVERCRVKDSVNVVWWLSKTERPKANNEGVLVPYSRDMEQLLERQSYNGGVRPGGARVNPRTWKKRHAGAIPPNVLELPFVPPPPEPEPESNLLRIGGSESASRYHRAYKALERRHNDDEERLADLRERVRKHPARFPIQLPTFFVKFLTSTGDLVVDPFAGSNVTGQAAEDNGRRWAAFELCEPYMQLSIARFDSYYRGDFEWFGATPPLLDEVGPEELSA